MPNLRGGRYNFQNVRGGFVLKENLRRGQCNLPKKNLRNKLAFLRVSMIMKNANYIVMNVYEQKKII